MLNEIIFVTGIFLTRVVLPVVLMFVLGEFARRRLAPDAL